MSRTHPVRRPTSTKAPQVANRRLIIAGLVLTLATASAFAAQKWIDRPSYSNPQAEQCVDVHAVAIDISDPLTEIQWRQLKQRLYSIGQGNCTKPQSILIGQYRPETQRPFVVAAKEIDPGHYAGIFSAQGKYTKTKEREAFQQRFKNAIDSALTPDTSTHSLIIEGTSYLTRLPEFSSALPHGNRYLTIVSDLEENPRTGACSVLKYARLPASERKAHPFKARCKSALEINPLDLRNTVVEVLLLVRAPPGKVPDEAVQFFNEWFTSAGATLVMIKPVS